MHAAGNIECTMVVENTGTVRINGLNLTGPDNFCTKGSALLPGSNYTCILRKAVSQAAFDAQEAGTTLSLSLPVTAAGTTSVGDLTVLPAAASVFDNLVLPISKNMTAESRVSKATVSAKGRYRSMHDQLLLCLQMRSCMGELSLTCQQAMPAQMCGADCWRQVEFTTSHVSGTSADLAPLPCPCLQVTLLLTLWLFTTLATPGYGL
jgi:hypothetical protein